jgi:hypothetical protein
MRRALGAAPRRAVTLGAFCVCAAAVCDGTPATGRVAGDTGKTIVLHATEKGLPRLHLEDGRRLPAVWRGEARRARPLSLASGDLDEDGLTDLVAGYAAADGAGIVSVRAGSPDPATPFKSEATVFATPDAPGALAVGDFDADGHLDVLAAAPGGTNLAILHGDGSGRLAAARTVSLPGRVSAIATGEYDRPDGLDDVVVAISGAGPPVLLIFAAPEGALRSAPGTVSMPATVPAMAMADLDGDGFGDLAVAAGSVLVIVRGRSEALTSDAGHERIVERHALSSEILSLAAGEFTGDAGTDLALLLTDGAVRIVDPATGRESVPASPQVILSVGPAALGGDTRGAAKLIAANVSAHRADDLVLSDSAHRRVHLLTLHSGRQSGTMDDRAPPMETANWLAVPLEMEAAPVAVLPMLLNGDALDDLVLIDEGSPAPAVALTSPVSTFTVTNTNDGGAGSLRQAMLDAEASPGADSILFSIPGPGPHTISPISPLPALFDPVTIDATSEPDFAGRPVVEIAGNLAGAPRGGIDLVAGDSVVRGLVINRFGGSGIVSEANRRNRFEGNFIGTDVTGTLDLGNAANGMTLLGASENTIGGTTPAAQNLVSGNDQDGVFMGGADARSNLVQGNFIGTDVTGTAPLGNTINGVQVNAGPANTIGGTAAGARNVISGNSVGVRILGSGANNNLVQGNFIGTDVNGTARLGNSMGVLVSDFSFSTIGGTAESARNLISGNTGAAVSLSGSVGTGNTVQGNFIGTDVTGMAPLGNAMGMMVNFGSCCNVIGGTVPGARNVISGNDGIGIRIDYNQNVVKGNLIGTTADGAGPLGNGSDGVFLHAVSPDIVGGTEPDAGNTIAFNGGDGIALLGAAMTLFSNSIHSNGGLGVDLAADGVTPNDPGDGDSGANNGQNFPVISSAENAGEGTTIRGSLNSAASTTYRIEFFSSPACDGSGHGEAESFLGFTTQATDGSGNTSFIVTLATPVSAGRVVTATATSPGGDTSELSQCRTVVCTAATPAGSPSLTVDGDVVSWSVIATAGAYDLVRGDVTTLRATGGDFSAATQECLANDAPTTSFVYSPDPSPGEAFWFLARPVNCAGPGSYDTGAPSQAGSRDAEIAAAPAPCP